MGTVVGAASLFAMFGGRTASRDLLSFWCASALFREHSNPYASSTFGSCIGSVHPSIADPVVWWPPWSFALLGSFASLGFESFAQLWLAISCIAFAAAVHLCGTLWTGRRGGASEVSWYALFALSFGPMYLALFFGQLTGLLLCCLCVFLRMYRDDAGGLRGVAGGALLAVLLMKPHLVYLLVALVVWREVRARRRVVLAGLAGGFGVLCAVPLLTYPHVYVDFVTREAVVPTFWRTASIASALAELVEFRFPVVIFVPAAVAVGALAAVVLWRPAWLDGERMLVGCLWLGVVTAPYVWPYDFGLLLPVAAWVLTRGDGGGGHGRQLVSRTVLIVSNVVFLLVRGDMFHDSWYPWAIGVAGVPWLLLQGPGPRS